MVQYHLRSSKQDPTILDIPGGAYSWRWDCLERHTYYSQQKMPINSSPYTWRAFSLAKCKLRAKDTVYWPVLNEDLKKLVLNCELYLKYPYSKHKQKPSTSLGQEIPVHPWTKLATDIFPFWRFIIFVISGLYQQISSCPQIVFYDRATCCKPMQANLLWIWMAWNLDFW